MSETVKETPKTVSKWKMFTNLFVDTGLLVRFLGRLLKDSRVPVCAKLKLAGAGLYVWLDGDIVHDQIKLIPGIGYVDDVILVVHGIKCLVSEIHPTVAVELWPGDEASYQRAMTAVLWLDDQLYERSRRLIRKALDKLVDDPAREPAPVTVTKS